MAPQIRIAQDAEADEVLSNDPFALLVGMLLDQQYPMEHAFRGPWKILSRFGTLDPEAIAAAEPEAFADLCATPPAIHRYGRSMAGRVQQLAAVVRDEYGGRPERIWTEAADAKDLLARLRALPGYGDQKARIFAALLAKQLDVRPAGWQEAIGPDAEDGHEPGTVYVAVTGSGLMRRTLPRRSFVFAELRWASKAGLRLERSSIGE